MPAGYAKNGRGNAFVICLYRSHKGKDDEFCALLKSRDGARLRLLRFSKCFDTCALPLGKKREIKTKRKRFLRKALTLSTFVRTTQKAQGKLPQTRDKAIGRYLPAQRKKVQECCQKSLHKRQKCGKIGKRK